MSRTLQRLLALTLAFAMLLPNFATAAAAEEESISVTEETAEPAAEITEPAPEPTEPEEEPTEPVSEPTEPREESIEPAPEPTEPAQESTEPPEETAEPSLPEPQTCSHGAVETECTVCNPVEAETYIYTEEDAYAAIHSHSVCGKSCACTSTTHAAVSWTAWDGSTKMYGGYYYLTQDVVLSSTMILDYSYSTYLCLNGHSITCEDTVFDIYSYRSLTITDCVGTGKIDSTDAMCTISNNKLLTIWGGTILNSRSSFGVAIDVYNGTTTHLYGGRVEGTCGMFTLPGSKIYIHGGTLHGNLDSAIYSNGDGSGNVGSVTVSGGNVTTAAANAAAVSLMEEDFIMTGGYVGGSVDTTTTASVSGGTIDGALSAEKKTSITGGKIKGLSMYGGAEILSGTFDESCYFFGETKISSGTFGESCYFQDGNTTITGGDFSGAEVVELNGEAWIAGGSYHEIRAVDDPLYLSGVPEIDTLGLQYPAKVSAQNKDGTGTFGGNPVKISLYYTYTQWKDGDILITNVKSDTVAAKFTLEGEDPQYTWLERSGNNLVLRILPHGTWGSNISWGLEDGVLTISGTGAVKETYSGTQYPWGPYANEITKIVVEPGITDIPKYAFEYCEAVTTIVLPETLKTLWLNAFNDCGSLNNLLLPASLTLITGIGSTSTPEFIRCESLTDVYYLGTEDELKAIAGVNGIGSYSSDMTIHYLQLHESTVTCTSPGTEAYYQFEDTSVYGGRYNMDKQPITQLETIPALGHRVIMQQTETVDPLVIDNTDSVPFTLTSGKYTSNNHTHGTSSQLLITAQYACTLTLNYGVSSEQNYDKLYILQNSTQMAVISGSVTNNTLTLSLAAGDVVTIRYTKDSSVSSGDDQGWVSLDYAFVQAPGDADVPADTVEPTCTDAVVCSYCQIVVKEALGHTWTASTCSVPKTCDRCGTTEGSVNPDNHTFTNGVCACGTANPNAHSHSLCGNTDCADHGTVIFKELTSWKELEVAGNYCLGDTISVVDEPIYISYEVHLCLGGRTGSLGSQKIIVTNAGSLTICDCAGNGTITGGSSEGAFLDNAGTIHIYGGTVAGNHVGILSEESSNLTVSGGTVTGTGKSGVGISSKGSLTVSGGTVTGPGDAGIYNYGTATVSDGTVTGGVDGIYNFGAVTVSGGDITGTNDSGIRSIESTSTIQISGGTVTGGAEGVYNPGTATVSGGTVIGTGADNHAGFGIDNRGILMVSGGNVTGQKESGIYNEGTLYLSENPRITGAYAGIYVHDVENSSIYAKDSTGSTSYRGSKLTVSLSAPAEGQVVIQNLNTRAGYSNTELFELVGTEFFTLALGTGDNANNLVVVPAHRHSICGDTDCADHGTVTFKALTSWSQLTAAGNYCLSDSLPSYDSEVTITGDVKLCLAGKTVNLWSYPLKVASSGKLTICDCGTGGTLQGSCINGVVCNSGAMTVFSGAVSGASRGIYNDGDLTVAGGTISADGTNEGHGIWNYESGSTLTITGGTFSGTTNGVRHRFGTAVISGGSFTGGQYGLYNETGTMTVSGGTAHGNTTGFHNASGSVTVSGGTFTGGQYGLQNNDTAAVSGGSFSGGSNGIHNFDELYLAGKPAISSTNAENADIYLYNGSISAKDSAGTTVYSGDPLTLEVFGFSNGTAVVQNVTDSNQDKFSLTDPGYELTRSGDNLVLHCHLWSSSWSGDADGHWHPCSRDFCNITDNTQKKDYATHTAPADDGNCTTAVTCKTCSYEFTAAKEHSFTENSGNQASAATCTSNRKDYAKCANCDVVSDTVTIEVEGTKLSHPVENGVCTVCGVVPIDAINFPDDIFRAYVSDNFDADQDGCLTETERNAVTNISVGEMGIASLIGVEHFTELTYLSCYGNTLTSLDVSSCKALAELYCYDSYLTVLDLSANTNLELVYCFNNQLTSLTLGSLPKLRGLLCHMNSLSTLDVTGCTALKDLSCSENQLTALNLDKCPDIRALSCYDNHLTSLDVTQLGNLQTLYCGKNQIPKLDISSCSQLTELSCYENALTELELKSCTNLTNLFCADNQLTKLDISGNRKLQYLFCFNNQIATLDVSPLGDLLKLDCSFNQITSLNIKGCGNLTYLGCDSNQLAELLLKDCANLTVLRCHFNQLSQLDISRNPQLTELICYCNQLTSLDLSASTRLTQFSSFSHSYGILIKADSAFDLTSLPGGFDASKASNWVGGSVDGNILTVDAGASEVTYDYDCGNGKSASFTLNVERAVEQFQLGGASMTLGNSLTINFAVKETDITPEEAEQNLYYAKITRSYTDGRSDDVITVDSKNWTDYGTVRGIAYNGIAAKEMADSFQVQIFNRDNVAVSELWSDSVRDYAMRILNKGTNAHQQTLLVDMLNYGAAAQVYFGYSSADLANKDLTETQKGYATKNVNMTNNLEQGNNYFAASLTLESNIKLTIAFQNMSQTKVKDMYAIVTFTDHYGKKQETRIEGENFFVVSASGGRYGVTVENMVVADAYQPITCTVYNADGSIHGSAVDSVESYLARKMDSNALFAPIAKFCTSAYQYFHH